MINRLNVSVYINRFTVAVAIILSPLIVTSPVFASGENFAAVSNKATLVSQTVAVHDLLINGTGNDTLNLNMYVPDGTLAMSATTGVTVDPNSTANNLQVSGARVDINTALSTLTYTSNTPGTFKIEATIGGADSEVYNSANQHVYKVVLAPDQVNGISWDDAKTAAAASTYGGVPGYLATVTSQQESSFIASRITSDGWIGGADPDHDGTWTWQTGPETGTVFSNGVKPADVTVPGEYSNWNAPEPNNAGGEYCVELLTSNNGQWNDLNCNSNEVKSYVIEYGAPGNLPSVVSTSLNVVVSAVDEDNDSVATAIEDAAPNGGDGNNDGVADSSQPNVTSFVNPVNNKYVTLQLNNVCSITSAFTASESANTKADDSYVYNTGLVNFTANCGTNGFVANVKLFYHGVTNQAFVARKYNPATQTYATIDGAVLTQETVGSSNATVLSYDVTDGGLLDTDGLADGNITDPVGLASLDSSTTTTLANTGQSLFTFMALGVVSVIVAASGLLLRNRIHL